MICLNLTTLFINILFYTLFKKIYKFFLPLSRKGKDVFVCFSKGVLAILTVVELCSLILSVFGLKDV